MEGLSLRSGKPAVMSASAGLFIKALIPLGKIESLGLSHFLKTTALNTAASEIKFRPEFWRGHHIKP